MCCFLGRSRFAQSSIAVQYFISGDTLEYWSFQADNASAKLKILEDKIRQKVLKLSYFTKCIPLYSILL